MVSAWDLAEGSTRRLQHVAGVRFSSTFVFSLGQRRRLVAILQVLGLANLSSSSLVSRVPLIS